MTINFQDWLASRQQQQAPQPPPTPLRPVEDGEADAYAITALNREVDQVANAANGTRNHTLNTAAFNLGQLVAAGHLTRETVEQQLTAAAQTAGLPTSEIRGTIKSGLGGGIRSGPRQVQPLPDLHTVTETTLDAITGEVTETATDFWDTRDHLTHIRDFARARMASPWAVLGVVLARAIALTPWTVQLPPIVGGKASLNITIAVTARSGGGKGAAEAAANEAFIWPHIPEYRIGSGEAIAHCLKYRLPAGQGGGTDWNHPGRNALISMPEVDKLTGQAARQGSTIMAELRSAWSGESLGHITADTSRRIPVEAHSYRLALVLGVQPLRAEALLDDADGGFPQRITWVTAIDPHGADRPTEAPKPLPWTAPDIHPMTRTGDTTINVCEQAVEEIRTARRDALRGVGDPLDGHRLLVREKVAAALGILDGRYSVTDEDWALAGVVMKVSDHTRRQAQAELAAKKSKAEEARANEGVRRAVATSEAVADAAVQRVCRNILRHVKAAEEMPWSALSKKLASRDREHFEDAMSRLEDAGQVAVEGDESRRTVKVVEEK